jgi:hypothetical protein
MAVTKNTAAEPKQDEDAPKSPNAPQTEGSTTEPTTTTATSGATVEQAVVDALPLKHPAIDSEPRKGLPPESSQIDMNDPNS